MAHNCGQCGRPCSCPDYTPEDGRRITDTGRGPAWRCPKCSGRYPRVAGWYAQPRPTKEFQAAHGYRRARSGRVMCECSSCGNRWASRHKAAQLIMGFYDRGEKWPAWLRARFPWHYIHGLAPASE